MSLGNAFGLPSIDWIQEPEKFKGDYIVLCNREAIRLIE